MHEVGDVQDLSEVKWLQLSSLNQQGACSRYYFPSNCLSSCTQHADA